MPSHRIIYDIPQLRLVLQFSLCVHIKYLHMAKNNTLLSYFAEGQDNELSLFTSKSRDF